MFSSKIAALLAVVSAAAFVAASPVSVKRQDVHSGIASYTDFDGTTACGRSDVNTNTESVVGIAGSIFSTDDCGRVITITAGNGKTTSATIVESCGDGCADGDLIVSRKTFQDIAPLDQGVFNQQWQFQ